MSVTAPEPVIPAAGSFMQAFHTQRVILILLVTLSGVGIAVTDSFPTYGYNYWLAMGPIFCAINVYAAWAHLQDRRPGGVSVLVALLLHWAAFLAAIYLVFLLLRAGRMNNEDAGLVALMALALTTFLSGIYSDIRFCVAGILLGAIVAGGSFVERFLWMLLVPLVALLVLAVVWWRRSNKGIASA